MSKEYIENYNELIEHPKKISDMFNKIADVLNNAKQAGVSLSCKVLNDKNAAQRKCTDLENERLLTKQECQSAYAKNKNVRYSDSSNDEDGAYDADGIDYGTLIKNDRILEEKQSQIKELENCEEILAECFEMLNAKNRELQQYYGYVKDVSRSYTDYMTKIADINKDETDYSSQGGSASSGSSSSAVNYNSDKTFEARQRLLDYMSFHNYSKDDENIYKYDAEWKELHRDAFPQLYEKGVTESTYSAAKLNCWEISENIKSPQQCLAQINPNYFSDQAQWKYNCQRCVPAYELARRGVDVTALPAQQLCEELSVDPYLVWKDVYVHSCSQSSTGKEEIETKMAQWGDGARVEITVFWKNSDSGHAFVAEQIDGKTVFLDPQNNRYDCSDYFDSVELGETQFARIDNLELSDKIGQTAQRRI